MCSCGVYDARLLDGKPPHASDGGADAGDSSATEADTGVDAADGGASGGAATGAVSGSSGVGGADSGAGGSGAGGAGSPGSGGNGGSGSGGNGDSGAGGAGVGGTGAGGTAGTGPCVPSPDVDCCPSDPNKLEPGVCGCGTADTDSNNDAIADCLDPAPYGWQRKLTLDGSQIAGSLSSFPVLVRLTDAQLASTAAISGSDIYFTAADQLTLLDFEIESYAPATGTLVAWVRVPSLSAGTDAVLYLGYGDDKPNRSNVAGVWSDHHYVWHLAQDPSAGSGAIKDSTQRAHGTAQGNMSAAALVPAVAGTGLSFDGNDDLIAFTNTITGTGPSTFSGWIKPANDTGDLGSSLISIGNGNGNQARFLLLVHDPEGIRVGFYSNDEFSNTVLPLGSWKHVVWVWTGTQTTLYVDGAVVFGPVNHSGANTSGSNGRIGAGNFDFDYFATGQFDEIRVATTARTAAWIATEYSNQRPSSTFIKTIGAAEAAPAH